MVQTKKSIKPPRENTKELYSMILNILFICDLKLLERHSEADAPIPNYHAMNRTQCSAIKISFRFLTARWPC